MPRTRFEEIEPEDKARKEVLSARFDLYMAARFVEGSGRHGEGVAKNVSEMPDVRRVR